MLVATSAYVTKSIGVTRHVDVLRGETSLERFHEPIGVANLWTYRDVIQIGRRLDLAQCNVEISGLFNSFHGLRIDTGSKAGYGPEIARDRLIRL